jgi:hypothetical protein
MPSRRSAELAHDEGAGAGQDLAAEKHEDIVVVRAGSDSGRSTHVPLRMKLLSILMVTAIGFGSHWSSGVTGAMKSTLKKVRVWCIFESGRCGVLMLGVTGVAYQ